MRVMLAAPSVRRFAVSFSWSPNNEAVVQFREMMRAAALTAALGLAMSANAEPQPMKDLAVLAPKVIAWAQALSGSVTKSGAALTALQRDIAVKSGVREPSRIRVVVVDRVPLP